MSFSAKHNNHNTRLIYQFLEKAYPSGSVTVEQLIQDNVLNGAHLAELAISRQSNIPLCKIGDYRDLVDDSDVKTTTVRKASFNKNGVKYREDQYICTVRGLENKIGILRIIAYNPFSEKWHYLLVPASAYKKYKELKISFDRQTQAIIGRYAQFEVSEFEGVCREKTSKEELDSMICSINDQNRPEMIEKIYNYMKSQ